ncbi:unnamed protein product [Schistosoma mattheei]|uniref:Uncharacterized protein n=1 Tax=Schistosoma mattheei TaxID=31246 RepID=A0A3P8ERN6_9TREM|nr:unnamed protein product [Schistosoma mattheei]
MGEGTSADGLERRAPRQDSKERRSEQNVKTTEALRY